jgi:hypothetical protein
VRGHGGCAEEVTEQCGSQQTVAECG